MNTYIYSFDLSMSRTGIAIFDLEGNLKKITSIETRDKDSHGVRLKAINDKIQELVNEFSPEKIIIERAFSRFNIATAVLYRVHGLINFIFWNLKQIYYTPATVKKTILKGNATKQQIQNKIIFMYPNVKFENDDESDACAVGLTYFIKEGIINWK